MTHNPKHLVGIKKPPLRFIPPQALLHLGQAMQDGGIKYGPFNWRKDPIQITTYYDAALRHWMAFIDGEDFDPDSGHHHMAHAMACAAIVIDAIENDVVIDDRPFPGNTPDLIKRLHKDKKIEKPSG